MSIVQRVLGKSKKSIAPVKQYNNPKADGLYRMCFHCESLFKIDDLSKAALCWPCALKVIRSGHYLGPHLTLPPYKYYDDAMAQATQVKSQPVIEKVVTKPKPSKPTTTVWKICKCSKRFKMKTTRQKRCQYCLSNAKGKKA